MATFVSVGTLVQPITLDKGSSACTLLQWMIGNLGAVVRYPSVYSLWAEDKDAANNNCSPFAVNENLA